MDRKRAHPVSFFYSCEYICVAFNLTDPLSKSIVSKMKLIFYCVTGWRAVLTTNDKLVWAVHSAASRLACH